MQHTVNAEVQVEYPLHIASEREAAVRNHHAGNKTFRQNGQCEVQ